MAFLLFVALLLIPVAVSDFRRGYRLFERISDERNLDAPGENNVNK